MKTGFKILTLVMVVTFLLSSFAMAMPNNTVVIGNKAFSIASIMNGVDGIQAALDAADGKLYYSLEGQTSGFEGLFSGAAMTQAQMDELSNIEYVKADGSKVTYARFDDPVPVEELAVVGAATAVNSTTIRVTFNDGEIKDFTVAELSAGSNSRTVSYQGKSFTVTANYQPAEITVQEVKRDNYRHFQVIFSGEVDLDSAERAENYYFFINEGNTDYKAVLPASNQLDTIAEDIVATNVNGKTVVDIYLPEDARFTNIADFLQWYPSAPANEILQQMPIYQFWSGPYGFDSQAWIDDEESIVVNMSNDVHGLNSNFWALTKGKEVQLAVRNIRDLRGARSIDTVVLPMQILDDRKPELKDVYTDENDFPELVKPGELSTAAVPAIQVYTDDSEKITMEFDEPVFNTHGLGVGDINNTGHYNVEVAVDNQKVASTTDVDLTGILRFYMDAEDDYDQACLVDLNIKDAIERLYTDGFRAGNTYNIKITGITDLAGNIMDPQVIEFNVTLIDRNGSDNKVIPAPQIIDVDQIHDNVFRVYVNRNDVTGKFEIRNADGEDGLIEYSLTDFPVVKVNDNLWYYDVVVRAVDIEKSLGVGVRDDQLLAYDNQNTLIRTLRVYNVADSSDDMTGNSYENNAFIIKKDINAPVVETPDEIAWDRVEGKTGSTIVLDVKDIVPDSWTDVGQPVYAMLYDWKFDSLFNNLPFGVFDSNSINTVATEWYYMFNQEWVNMQPWQAGIDYWQDFLPITVSYTVEGETRTAVVSNRCILEEFANRPAESGRHYGAPGSIRFDYDTQQLVIDLAPGNNENCWYKDLLDSEGNLVQGVTYQIQIPDGYFADQARLNAYDYANWSSNTVDVSKAVYFVPDDKILYVSDGRNNNSKDEKAYNPIHPFAGDASESFMVHGYTSGPTLVSQVVGVEPIVVPEPDDAVPQTSKELINWVEDRNEIWVEFTGTIDPATLRNPANYVLNGKTLAAMGLTTAGIEYVVSHENEWVAGDDRIFAKIKLPYDTIQVDGDYEFSVSGVANMAGGTMTPVTVRLDIDENFRPVIQSARIIGNHEIELTFNELVRYTADAASDPENLAIAAKDNFVVYVGGTAIVPSTATIGTTPPPSEYSEPPYPMNKIVRLYVGLDLLSNNSSVTVDVVYNQNDKVLMEDNKCNPLNTDVAPFVVR